LVHGQHWHVGQEHGRLVYQDENGLVDAPLPALPGAHQIENAGIAIAALRQLGFDDQAHTAAMTNVSWPARMQRLTSGILAERFADRELWLDGGHNPAAGEALAKTLRDQSPKSLTLVCGMLNTKDVSGYMRPLADVADHLTAIAIPGEENTLPAQATADAAAAVGLSSDTAASLEDALQQTRPGDRVLICGSLYLAGHVLRENEKK